MKFPELPKWQLIALPLVLITMGVFYFGKYYVAEELIRANQTIGSLQKELQTQRDLLDLMQTRQELYDLLGYTGYEQRDRQYFGSDEGG